MKSLDQDVAVNVSPVFGEEDIDQRITATATTTTTTSTKASSTTSTRGAMKTFDADASGGHISTGKSTEEAATLSPLKDVSTYAITNSEALELIKSLDDVQRLRRRLRSERKKNLKRCFSADEQCLSIAWFRHNNNRRQRLPTTACRTLKRSMSADSSIPTQQLKNNKFLAPQATAIGGGGGVLPEAAPLSPNVSSATVGRMGRRPSPPKMTAPVFAPAPDPAIVVASPIVNSGTTSNSRRARLGMGSKRLTRCQSTPVLVAPISLSPQRFISGTMVMSGSKAPVSAPGRRSKRRQYNKRGQGLPRLSSLSDHQHSYYDDDNEGTYFNWEGWAKSRVMTKGEGKKSNDSSPGKEQKIKANKLPASIKASSIPIGADLMNDDSVTIMELFDSSNNDGSSSSLTAVLDHVATTTTGRGHSSSSSSNSFISNSSKINSHSKKQPCYNSGITRRYHESSPCFIITEESTVTVEAAQEVTIPLLGNKEDVFDWKEWARKSQQQSRRRSKRSSEPSVRSPGLSSYSRSFSDINMNASTKSESSYFLSSHSHSPRPRATPRRDGSSQQRRDIVELVGP